MGYIHVCTYIYINNYYESTEEKKTQATPTMRLNKASRVYAVCAHRLPNGRSEAVGFEERPYIRAAPDRHDPPNLPFSPPPPPRSWRSRNGKRIKQISGLIPRPDPLR